MAPDRSPFRLSLATARSPAAVLPKERSRRRRGLFHEARAAFAEGLALSRGLDDRLNESRFLHNLANVDQQLGRLPEAEAGFRGAIALKREARDQRGLALSLESLSTVLMKRGSLGEVEALLAEAEATSRDLGTQRELALILSTRADLDRPYTSPACRRLEAAARDLQALADQNVATVQIEIARCWNEAGSPRRASSWLDLAARDPIVSRSADVRIELALARADDAIRGRRWPEAEGRLDETAAECRRLSLGKLLLQTRLLQARLARARGDHPERVRTLAEELQRDARAAGFERIARLAGEVMAGGRPKPI